MSKIRIDLTGKIFGDLTVVGLGERRITISGSRKITWNCVCKCGNKSTVDYQNLVNKLTSSCGCKSRGIGKSWRFPGEPTWFSFMWTQYKNGARDRNLTFELTHIEFKDLVLSNCYYCGATPEERNSNPALAFNANGIDRKINSIGYTAQNCVACCTKCNRMKMSLNYNDFLSHIQKIANYVRT